jgi:hypothetical protein
MVRTEDDQPDHRLAASASKGFIRRDSLHWLALAVGVAAVCLALRAPAPADETLPDTQTLFRDGRNTFRYDTFGDEVFWGGSLKLHLAVEGQLHGGVGPGLSPRNALRLGLKVDVDSLTDDVKNGIANGTVDLDDPATTLALLKLNSVVGVTGFFDPQGQQLTAIGIQCALCHSTVDDSFAPGIGSRRDAWANRDLDVGKITSLAPDLSSFANLLNVTQDDVRTVLQSWGPGKFDAELVLDGKAFQPNGNSSATLIPPAFGLQGVNLHTWTGWGSMTYWNAFVANIEMHGQGTFHDSRLENSTQFPIAARAGFAHITHSTRSGESVDRVSPKLSGLHYYQMSIQAPPAPRGSFDEHAAERGELVFDSAGCNRCHVEPMYTEPGWNMHRGADIGIDEFQALRAPDKAYRTTPLKGLWTHVKGGFFHDGRFATLDQVVAHYDSFFGLGLSAQDQADLVQYLLSL